MSRRLSAGGSKGIFAAPSRPPRTVAAALFASRGRLLVLIHTGMFNYSYHTTFCPFVKADFSVLPGTGFARREGGCPPEKRRGHPPLTDTGTAAGYTGRWPPESTPSCETPTAESPPPGERTPPAPPCSPKSATPVPPPASPKPPPPCFQTYPLSILCDYRIKINMQFSYILK